MLNSYKLILFSLLLIIIQPAVATVYKCQKNGDITFSDTPCQENSRDITDSKLNAGSAKKGTTNTYSSQTEKIKKASEKMETERVKREVDRDIKMLEKKILKKKKEQEDKLLELKNKKKQIGIGDTLDEEMEAEDFKKLITEEETEVKKQYALEIEKLTKKISEIQKKLK